MTLSRVKVPGESCTLSRACQALLTPKVSGYRGTSVGLAWHKCRGVSSNGAGLRAFPSHSPVGRHFAPGVARGITAPQRGANTAPKRRGLRPPGPPWAAPPPPAVPSALWGGTPATAGQPEEGQATGRKKGLSDHGGSARGQRRRRGSLGLAGGQPLAVVHGPPRRGARGCGNPRPGIRLPGRKPR